MKALIVALIVSTAAQASALYHCTSPVGYDILVERTEHNSLHVSIEAPANLPNVGYICFGSDKETSSSLTVHARAEVIGEDPSSCTFKLNKKTLQATYAYKRWSGYFRGPFAKPAQKANLTATCVAAE